MPIRGKTCQGGSDLGLNDDADLLCLLKLQAIYVQTYDEDRFENSVPALLGNPVHVGRYVRAVESGGCNSNPAGQHAGVDRLGTILQAVMERPADSGAGWEDFSRRGGRTHPCYVNWQRSRS